MLARQLPVIMVLELALELAPELTLGHREQELTMIMVLTVDL